MRDLFRQLIETAATLPVEEKYDHEDLKNAVVDALVMMCRDYQSGKVDAEAVVNLGYAFDDIWGSEEDEEDDP